MTFNRPRAEQFMRDADADVLVAAAPVNVRYLSGMHTWLDATMLERMVVPGGTSDLAIRAMALLPLEGDPALILNAGLVANALDSWIEPLYVYGPRIFDAPPASDGLDAAGRRAIDAVARTHDGLVPALAAALADRGLAEARVALDADGLPANLLEAISAALPRAEIRNASNLLRLVRMVKSDGELDRLRRAADIAERAAMATFAAAHAGVRLPELAQDFRARVAAEGADFEHYAYGVRGLSLATITDYALQPDDCFCVDFGCFYDGYVSDSATTIAVSPLPEELVRKHEQVGAVVAAGLAAMRPGTRASAVFDAIHEAAREIGIQVEGATGHGLGLEPRDLPVLVPDNGRSVVDDCVDVASDLPLEVGMVMNVEASCFLPGRASLEVERTVVIESDGAVDLIPQPREHPVVAAAG